MKFCWSTVTVNNMEESIKFYQDIVGLTISQRFKGGPSTELCFLGEGETKLELICDPNHPAPGQIEGISLGFTVDSLDKMMELIKEKGLSIESGPFQPNPYVKYFFVKDPNGLSIQFVENIVTD